MLYVSIHSYAVGDEHCPAYSVSGLHTPYKQVKGVNPSSRLKLSPAFHKLSYLINVEADDALRINAN